MSQKINVFSKSFLVSALVIISSVSFADAAKPSLAESELGQVIEETSTSWEHRQRSSYFGYLNYGPADLIIPSKWGGTVGWVMDMDQTWEFEYMRGRIAVPFLVEDLGSMTDLRLSLIGRSYMGKNSFNISYGISYFDFKAHLGSDLLNRVSGGGYPSLDVIRIQSVGLNIGFGNRWNFKHNISLGVDWITWSQPIATFKRDSEYLNYATDPEDRDDAEKVVNLVTYMPRLSFFKLQLGILF